MFGEPVGWRRWLAIAAGFIGVLIIVRPGVAGFNHLMLQMQSIDDEEVLRERMIVGTAGSVVARLKELEETLGLDGILAELNPGSLIPHARVMTALRLLCGEVMPRFR